MLKPVFALIMLVFILSFVSLHASADSGKATFKIGVEAFKDGDFTRAKLAFEEARQSGMDSPSLSYNLGVTYYRLKDFEKAGLEFKKLTGNPKWEKIAYYNLGLIAEKQGDTEKARSHFRKALSSKKSKVNTLASKALGQLPSAHPAHYVYATIYGGRDDNVTLLPDQEGEGSSDNQITGFVTGRYYLNQQWSLEALFYGRRFDEIHEFDTTLTEAGIHREHQWGRWRWDNAINVSTQTLQGDRYLDVARVETLATRNLTNQQSLRVSGTLARIRAAQGFEYLQGWQGRAQVDWSKSFSNQQFKIGYRLEMNDREDLESGEDFASFSPVRHLLKSDFRWPLSRRWNALASASYQHSAYRDEHVIQGSNIQRTDKRFVGSLRADFELSRGWKLFGEYRHTDNQSTMDIYDYDRNEWNVGIEYLGFY